MHKLGENRKVQYEECLDVLLSLNTSAVCLLCLGQKYLNSL